MRRSMTSPSWTRSSTRSRSTTSRRRVPAGFAPTGRTQPGEADASSGVSGTMTHMRFAEAQDAFFADYFRHYPVLATEAGNHEHDDQWGDLTDAGSRARLAWLADARRSL